jgi:hypothetical protein
MSMLASKFRWLVTCAVMGVFAVSSFAQQIENPEFTQWQKYKAGTMVVMKSTSTIAGMKTEAKITTKLVEVEKESLVLETITSATVNGMSFDAPAQKRTVAKMYEKPKLPPGTPQPPASGKPEGTTEEGTETVKVGDTEVKTKWYVYKSKTPVGEVEGKMWFSEDMPGNVVKMISKASGVETVMEVVEFKKP